MLESSFGSWMLGIFLLLSIPILIYYTVGFERFMPIVVVESQEAWVVDRWGKDRVLYEGLNRILPGVDKIEEKISLKEQQIDPPEQEIITKDNINITVDLISSIKVIDPLAAVMGVDDYKASVESLVMTSALTIMGRMELIDIQREVDSISKKIMGHMKENSDRWGVEIVQVHIEKIILPSSVKEAMEKEVVAVKEQTAMLTLAEGKKKAAIEEAEGKKIAAQHQAAALLHEIEMIQKSMPDMSNSKILDFLRELDYIHSMKNLSSSENAKFVVYPSGSGTQASDGAQPIDKIMSTEYIAQTMNKKEN